MGGRINQLPKMLMLNFIIISSSEEMNGTEECVFWKRKIVCYDLVFLSNSFNVILTAQTSKEGSLRNAISNINFDKTI